MTSLLRVPNILTPVGFVFRLGPLVVILLCPRSHVSLIDLLVSPHPTVGFYTIAMLNVLWATIVTDFLLFSSQYKRTDDFLSFFLFSTFKIFVFQTHFSLYTGTWLATFLFLSHGEGVVGCAGLCARLRSDVYASRARSTF